MIPDWAVQGLVGLARAIAALATARDDDERESVLMQAAEDVKAALDKKKFGGG